MKELETNSLEQNHGGNLFFIEKKYGINKTKIHDFSGNINPLGISPMAKEAIINNIDLMSIYPDPDYSDLKASISGYTNVPSEMIVMGNGATEIISKLIKFLSPSKALTLLPTYSEYEKEILQLGGSLDYFPLTEENDFRIPLNDFMKKMAEDYKLLVICNPNNPTSTALSTEEIRTVAKYAKEKGIFIIIDETYVEFCDNYNDITAETLVADFDNIFIIRGISKFFAAPGLRFGYGLTSNNKIINGFHNSEDPWSINIFASLAGETLFRDANFIKKSQKLIMEEKRYLYEELSSFNYIKVFKPITNFILCKLDKAHGLTARMLYDKLIKESILIRDMTGTSGLNEYYFRVCILNSSQNSLLINTLKRIGSK